MGLNHIQLYEGDKDPLQRWLICEKFCFTNDITNEDKHMTHLKEALRKRELTWFMNLIENQPKSKDEIKTSFLAFFRAQYVKHVATQKLNDVNLE